MRSVRVSEGVSDTLYTRTNISDAQYKEIEREREIETEG
jgi:hypothetical protein